MSSTLFNYVKSVANQINIMYNPDTRNDNNAKSVVKRRNLQ